MKERIIEQRRATTLVEYGHRQIFCCPAIFFGISHASLFFRGWAWRIGALVVLPCEPRRHHPQSKPAAHVAPCTSFNVGDEGMCCAVLSRFAASSSKPAAAFERLACRLRGSLRSARPMLSVA